MPSFSSRLERVHITCGEYLEKFSTFVDSSLRSGFKGLGKAIAERPRVTIVCMLIFAALCASGITQIEVETDGEKLFTSQNADAFKDKEYVEKIWGFDPNVGGIYSLSLDGNILSEPNLLALMDVYDLIFSVSIARNKRVYSFNDICIRPDGVNCQIESILDFWNNSRNAIETDGDLLSTANSQGTTAFGRPITADQFLGGISYENNLITGARANVLNLYVHNNVSDTGSTSVDEVSRDFMLELSDRVRERNGNGNLLESYLIAAPVVDEEANSAITSDIPLSVIGYFILFFYGVFVMAKPNWVRSHGSLAAVSILSIILAVAASFGVVIGVGVKFNLVVQSLVLVLLGLGMDDAFVIVHSLMHQPRDLPVVERVYKALGHAGSSITITSVTDMVAFITGTAASLPALRDFSIFAAVGVVFLFLFQVTFFVAFMALDTKREKDGKRDCLCCYSVEESDQDVNCCIPSKSYDDDSKSISEYLVGEQLPLFLTNPMGKIAVLVLTAIVFGFGLNGALRIQVDFDYEWFVPDDSYLQSAFDIRDQNFERSVFSARIYTKEGDYFANQNQLDELTEQFKAIPSIRNNSVQSWYPSYIEWLSTSGNVGALDANGKPQTKSDFYTFLVEYLNDSGSRFKESIVFTDESQTDILSSRIDGLFEGLTNARKQIDALEDSRAVAETYGSAFDSIAYTFVYLFWEGFSLIQWETLQNLITAGSAVFVVCLILLASIGGSFMVFAVIVLVDVNLLGYAYYTGYYYNSVTAIQLILAVGLAVDYSAHICHSFLSAEGTNNERVHKALKEIGPSVLNGGVSTFLAVLPLAFSTSFIFQVFFVMFAYIVIFGLFHGLFFLPVLLSLVGPPSYPRKDKNKEKSIEMANKTTI